MIDTLTPYPAYKDSGLPWLGQVPEHWEVRPASGAFIPNKERNQGMKEKTVLSLSYGRIVIKPPEKLHGLVPESFETYQIVNPSDIVLRTTDLQNDHTSLRVGMVRDRGIITSAYLALRAKVGVSPEFAFQFLSVWDSSKAIYGYGSGLRQNLDFSDFKRMPIAIPPPAEQATIVRFLEWAGGRLERTIRAKRKIIALLNEQKQAIIHRAVTRGLDPDVPLKDSGIPWLGEIPAHWEIVRAKVLFTKMNRPVREHDEVVTCYRDGTVTLRKNRRLRGYTEATVFSGYQGIRKGDLIIHGMDAFAGAIGVSDSDGKGTPVYNVCQPKPDVNANYYAHLLRKMAHSQWILALAKGIRERSTDFRFEMFGNQPIPIPPPAEQAAIVAYLDVELDRLTAISRLEREIELLREYRTRLISDVVTGKLDVRAAAATLPDEPSIDNLVATHDVLADDADEAIDTTEDV
jgi:type I restriction enzyme, S subunit